MITVLLTALVTLALTLIALNLITHERKIEKRIPRLYGSDAPEFRRTMDLLLGPAIVGGNKVQTLNNGDNIFPAMLAAIRGARLTLTFETYIYWSGGIGREFADALAERARAGENRTQQYGRAQREPETELRDPGDQRHGNRHGNDREAGRKTPARVRQGKSEPEPDGEE